MDTIVVAIIGCVGIFITAVCTLVGTVYSNKKMYNQTQAKIEYEIAELKKDVSCIDYSAVKQDISLVQKDISVLAEKVTKHNNLIERMFLAEKSISVLEERQKVANRRIDDLEKIGDSDGK